MHPKNYLMTLHAYIAVVTQYIIIIIISTISKIKVEWYLDHVPWASYICIHMFYAKCSAIENQCKVTVISIWNLGKIFEAS